MTAKWSPRYPGDSDLCGLNRRQHRKARYRRLREFIRAITPRLSRRAVADAEPLLRRRSS